MTRTQACILTAVLGLAAGAPLAAWLALAAAAPAVSPEAAHAALAASREAVLVDVSTPQELDRRRITAAFRGDADVFTLPTTGTETLPDGLRGRRLFLTSEDDVRSRMAAARARLRFGLDAVAVDGGNPQWAVAHLPSSGARPELRTWTLAGGSTAPAPTRDASAAAAVALAAAGFLLKPTYMLLALVLLLALRRRPSPEARLLAHALAWFLGGELLCALNMIAFEDRSLAVEYGHVVGMVAAVGLGLEAALRWAEHRVVRPDDTEHRCPLASTCARCFRQGGTRCRLRLAFAWAMGIAACFAPLPLLSPLEPTSYTARALGMAVPFQQPWLLQWLEARLLPGAALPLLAAGAALAFSRRDDRRDMGRRLAAFGLGCLGFGLFRLALFAFFRDALWWAGFWEEAAEWLGIAAIALALALFQGLWPARRAAV